jgi:hypothetical protein
MTRPALRLAPGTRRAVAAFLVVLVSAVALVACGGRSPGIVSDNDGGLDANSCLPIPCPSGAPWDPTSCSCLSSTSSSGVGTGVCAALSCPTGYVVALLGSICECLPLQQPTDASVTPVAVPDASEDVSNDISLVYPDTGTAQPDVYGYLPDVWISPPADAYIYPPPFDSGTPYYDSNYCPYYYYCGTGYTLGPNCQCELCPNTCPAGQQPGSGCNGCNACTLTCPAGFHYGQSCSCVPDGVDAGGTPPPDASPDAGGGCLLEGYTHCAVGAWCQLGTCPDGTTQYGCFCNADGTATCSVTCPVPPPCTIPGQASCPAGAQCMYGSCSGNPTGDVLVCSCNTYYGYYGYDSGGSPSAYCYTASCADGGPQGIDAGNVTDGGVTCLLAGYTSCAAGSYCALGTCPGGSTYGCTCNQDGTATCDLVCPTPPPCQIPGEGTCPYGQSCVFGCSGTTGTGLSCSCNYYGGGAYCSTVSCASVTRDN